MDYIKIEEQAIQDINSVTELSILAVNPGALVEAWDQWTHALSDSRS